MNVIKLSPGIKTALIKSVEGSIDMLNDMALDPMFLNPTQVRELAKASDEEIRKTYMSNDKQAMANVEELVNLEILLVELKAE